MTSPPSCLTWLHVAEGENQFVLLLEHFLEFSQSTFSMRMPKHDIHHYIPTTHPTYHLVETQMVVI